MPLTTFSDGAVIQASEHNNNFALCVLTDTARTITVTHTYSASQTFTGGWSAAAACTVTSASATALTVGANGATNPALQVDASTASSATGIKVKSAAAGAGVAVSVVSSGTNEDLLIAAKGTGAVYLDGPGQIRIRSATAGQLQVWYDTVANSLGIDVSSAGLVTYNASGASAKHRFSDPVEVQANLTISTGDFVVAAGPAYIGDTSNANITTGLTINQAGSDDQILALKSSDVSHAMTGLAEADTFAYYRKLSATAGGVNFAGLSSGTRGINLNAAHTTDDTAKSTLADACLAINGVLRSGTSVTTPGANANLAVIRANDTTRFIFDVEGSAHADVEWITF